jgi:hypothetical protein
MYTNEKQNKKLKLNVRNLNVTAGNVWKLISHTLKMMIFKYKMKSFIKTYVQRKIDEV